MNKLQIYNEVKLDWSLYAYTFLKSGKTEQLQFYNVQVYGCFKSGYFKI